MVTLLTKKEDSFALWLLEGIRVSLFRANDQSSIDGSSEPGTVRVPPKSTFLSLDGEPVSVTPSRPYRALSHKFRSISPSSPNLPHTVPMINTKQLIDPFQITDFEIDIMVYTLPVNGYIVLGSVDDVNH